MGLLGPGADLRNPGARWCVKTFAQRRADRIAELKAGAPRRDLRLPTPAPAAPARINPPPRLYSVAEGTLCLLLDILQSTKGSDPKWRAVGAEAVRQELTGAVSRGGL
jgi:hypothetical protein